MNSEYLIHHGIKGQKWGVRRYQNTDGSLTDAGKRRARLGKDKLEPDSYKPGSGAVDRHTKTGAVYRKFEKSPSFSSQSRSSRFSTHGGTYGKYGPSTNDKFVRGQGNKPGYNDPKWIHVEGTESGSAKTERRPVRYDRDTEPLNGGRSLGNVAEQKKWAGVGGVKRRQEQINSARERDTKAPGSESQNALRGGSPAAGKNFGSTKSAFDIRNLNRQNDTRSPGSEGQNTYMQRSQSEANVDKYQQDGKERTEELKKKAAEQAVNKYQEDGKKRTSDEYQKIAENVANSTIAKLTTSKESAAAIAKYAIEKVMSIPEKVSVKGESWLKKIFGKK